jgi:two-component system sensor histidine kinase/response regulator
MFLSKMGHELRAPMSAVIGMTDLALGTALMPQAREYLQTVKAEAESLMETIAHVLDFSDLDSAKLHLVMSHFSVRDLVEATLTLLRPRAETKGLSLISIIAPEIPDTLVGDSVRFGLIMKALVGNAIKFTQRGEVRVDVRLEACRDLEAIVCVAISDTGIGIQGGALKRVLEPFMQEDNSGKREYGGAGLGLTIASQLVTLMKGTLDIESTPSVGTTLRFTVCFEQVPPVDDFFMLDEYARRSGAL